MQTVDVGSTTDGTLEEERRLDGWRGEMGLRNLGLIYILVCVVLVGMVTWGMTLHATNNARQQTRDHGNKRTDSLLAALEPLMDDTVHSVMQVLIRQSTASLVSSLRQSMTLIHTMQNFFAITGSNETHPDAIRGYLESLHSFWYAQSEPLIALDVTFMSYLTPTGDWIVVVKAPSISTPDRLFIGYGKKGSYSAIGIMASVTGKLVPPAFPWIGLDFTDFGFVKKSLATLAPGGKGWTGVEPISDFIGAFYSARVMSNKNGADLGLVSASLDFKKLSSKLKAVTDEVGDEHTRLVAISRNPGEDQYRRVVAVSHGTATVKEFRSDDLTNTEGLFDAPSPDVNATDCVISSVAGLINGDFKSFRGTMHKESLDCDGTSSIWYILTAEFEDPFMWEVLLAIRQSFILGAINKEAAAVKARIEANSDETESESSSRSVIIFMLLSFCTLGVMGLAVLLVSALLKPLLGLRRDMGLVSEMQLEAIDKNSSESVFSEVAVMQETFEQVTRRIYEFRSFVPSSLLSVVPDITPAPTGNVTIVFTDIEDGPALWSLHGIEMSEGVEMHNAVMRRNIQKYHGYEVKTIGDAFMVAFGECVNAVDFALTAQYELTQERWGEELSHKDPLWTGLSVRMGMHCGEVLREDNELTGRSDYRGGEVAKAARTSAASKGGCVCLTETFLELVQEHFRTITPKVVFAGETVLKGLEGRTKLYYTVPHQLKGRLDNFSYSASEGPSLVPMGRGRLSGPQSQRMSRASSSRRSSGGGTSDSGSSVVREGYNTGFKVGQATVAAVRYSPVMQQTTTTPYNNIVRVIADLVSQTSGVLDTVHGDSFMVTWNTMKTCRSHILSSVMFVTDLERRKSEGLHVGMATGACAFGNAGNSTTKYFTTLGVPARSSVCLASYAVQVGTYALLGDCTDVELVGKLAEVRPFTRPIDRWNTGDVDKVVLYEVLTPLVRHTLSESSADLGGAQVAPTDPTHVLNQYPSPADYATAFDHTMQGDKTRFRELAARYPHDMALAHIVAALPSDGDFSQRRMPFYSRPCFDI